MFRGSLLATLVGALVGAAIGCQPTAAPPPEWNDAVVMEIETWRAEHEESYTRNWVTIEGLHFLKARHSKRRQRARQ